MDVASKLYVIISISDIYLLFQFMIVSSVVLRQRQVSGAGVTDPLLAIHQVRTQQLLLITISIFVMALQLWILETYDFHRGFHVLFTLIVCDVIILLIFSSQRRISALGRSSGSSRSNFVSLGLIPAFSVFIILVYISVIVSRVVLW